MIHKLLTSMLVALFAVVLRAEHAQAQIFTPTFFAPRGGNDIGVYLSDLGEFAVEGIYRSGNLGLRAGLVDFDDAALTVGGELRSPLRVTAPIDLALTAGLQGVLGDVRGWGLQGGLSIGHTFVPGGFRLTPYLHPRIAVVEGLHVRDHDDDELDLELLADLGLDFDFAGGWSVRIGLAFEDAGADWGIGIAWR